MIKSIKFRLPILIILVVTLLLYFQFKWNLIEVRGQSQVCHIEIQKYIHRQWIINRRLLDKLDALTLQPRLYLYSKIDKSQIENYMKREQELRQQIEFNEKLQQSLGSFSESPLIWQDLLLQNLQLRIAQVFNHALLYRRQHHFSAALAQIEKSFSLIKEYRVQMQSSLIKGFKSVEDYLCLAFYYQGKIFRSLAGYDLDQLDHLQLFNCEKSYLNALKLSPDHPAIHSSLGYLYNDMQRHAEALSHHRGVTRFEKWLYCK